MRTTAGSGSSARPPGSRATPSSGSTPRISPARTDLWENGGVFEESVSILDGKEFYCFQAIHQEADVVPPENIDCIRALMGTVKDPQESIRMTNEALGLVAIG